MEILNTVTGSPAGTGTLIALLIVFVIAAAASLCYLIYLLIDAISDRDLSFAMASAWLVAVALCVIVFILCSRGIAALNSEKETIVYATIDDSTPWSEINERYELIRQDGKIYQLRLREICQPEPDVV